MNLQQFATETRENRNAFISELQQNDHKYRATILAHYVMACDVLQNEAQTALRVDTKSVDPSHFLRRAAYIAQLQTRVVVLGRFAYDALETLDENMNISDEELGHVVYEECVAIMRKNAGSHSSSQIANILDEYETQVAADFIRELRYKPAWSTAIKK